EDNVGTLTCLDEVAVWEHRCKGSFDFADEFGMEIGPEAVVLDEWVHAGEGGFHGKLLLESRRVPDFRGHWSPWARAARSVTGTSTRDAACSVPRAFPCRRGTVCPCWDWPRSAASSKTTPRRGCGVPC